MDIGEPRRVRRIAEPDPAPLRQAPAPAPAEPEKEPATVGTLWDRGVFVGAVDPNLEVTYEITFDGGARMER